ncbi:protein ALP1-like [Setaria viridis]|uniref:protein ALP1-like n=1 Tax=Setaria viridis TaxID=4556 RepID=UPI003B3AA076
MLRCRKKRRKIIITAAAMLGMYHFDTYMNKGDYRVPTESGFEWLMKTLGNRTSCFNMFRMSQELFLRLHSVLVDSYGLKSTRKMSSVEALGLFLWICGAPQSVRQAEDRFTRSLETICRKFDEVLESVNKLAVDIIKPKDPEFRSVHSRLQSPRFTPFFDNCIGAIDGTHIPVVVPTSLVVQHTGRHGYTSQNVMAICDFDMRFTFVVAGWPGSVHDMRVFKDAIEKFGDKYPHPPEGKFYLVDSGYPNRSGYLAPYKGTKYHLPEFRQGPMPRGKKELFNYTHSSLRNVIERSFGVLKMKWRILLDLPSYPMQKQSEIIIACMALHNFIRESFIGDADFDLVDHDENYVSFTEGTSSDGNVSSIRHGDEDQNMNEFRDWIADGLFSRS